MPKETIFQPNVQHQINEIGCTDIVVGLCTHNHSRTVGQVLRIIRTGLEHYSASRKFLVVVSDGGSTDETMATVVEAIPGNTLVLFSHSLHPVYRINVPYHGLPGRATCLSAILEITKSLNAGVCLLIDPDSQSVTPEWVKLMVNPILEEGFDFVAPSYQRHKYDGTLTNSVLYPLTRSLYGQRIRQPIGPDVAFSLRMALDFLKKDLWHTQLVSNCPDLWMTTVAIAEGFKVCQSLLGARIQRARPHGADLSHLLTQVVGGVFDLMETYHTVWIGIKGSEPSPVFGLPKDFGVEPVNVNTERMIQAFNQGVADLSGIWEEFLSKDLVKDFKRLASLPFADFRFQDGLWVRTVFEFAAAYHNSRMDRSHLIKSMTPLYLGRTASFVMETCDSSAAEVENRIELLCLEFENLKSYLTECWEK
jgi:glycosyltransferase involved in cell wall biosynthesis